MNASLHRQSTYEECNNCGEICPHQLLPLSFDYVVSLFTSGSKLDGCINDLCLVYAALR